MRPLILSGAITRITDRYQDVKEANPITNANSAVCRRAPRCNPHGVVLHQEAERTQPFATIRHLAGQIRNLQTKLAPEAAQPNGDDPQAQGPLIALPRAASQLGNSFGSKKAGPARADASDLTLAILPSALRPSGVSLKELVKRENGPSRGGD